ncbi:class D sortase [Salibacterium halotolerans]|uniref:Sortase A n=1 Tax=Salibacterium halotolerans TaxID=1884432 RepID=A0A1I5V5C2_9BACI|nr:class D sortase [Salibacterium halotolerans]SFQ02753.1 sortase A [Salibacterium halotolerans]
MKPVAFLLVLAGIFLLFYPHVNEWMADSRQAELLEQWETAEASQVNTRAGRDYEELEHIFEQEETEEAPEPPPPESPEGKTETVGVLRIPAIEAELPVAEDASAAALEVAAGHLAGTAALGAKGNSAVAAHRSHTYGRMFNRLNEVEKGDAIEVETKSGTYFYTVFQTKVVDPSDTSVLRQDTNGKKVITLITCSPMKNPVNRLIVQGKLNE